LIRLTQVTHGPRDRPRVALTFDDGPGKVTGAVLEVLARHGARATFNVLGERVPTRRDLLVRILDEGHEVGSHARHHHPLAGHALDAFRQLGYTNRAIRRIAGVVPRVFRAPYGSVSRGVVLAARLHGLTTVGWDVDPRDYETPGASTIADRVLRGVRPGSIVLLHDDRRALAQTAVALEAILAELARRELVAVTVSELLAPAPRASG
jgi:peptidoglycan/xylan/chitin deacetylase (PgdA/CDA1 family)